MCQTKNSIADLKTLVAENRTGEALARLLELSQRDKPLHDSILIVSSEFKELNVQRLRGTVSNEEATLRQNKINEKVLMALESFDGAGRVLPGGVIPKKTSPAAILLGITLFLFGMGGIMELVGFRDGAAPFLVFGTFAFLAFLLALVISAFRGGR